MSPPISVALVTFNSEQHIEDLLNSLQTVTTNDVSEVVIVDNGSTDRTLEILASRGGVRVIQQENQGFAHGINRAIDTICSDDHVLVVNPDVRFLPGCIDKLRFQLDTTPTAAVVVPSLLDSSGEPRPSLRHFPSIWRTAVEALVGGSRSRLLSEAWYPDSATEPLTVDWATGAVMLLDRRAFEAVGRFDETFFLYSEETDYCQRIAAAGLRTIFEPSAMAIHKGGDLHERAELWALRAVNRVRRYRKTSNVASSLVFWAASILFEFRRAITGNRQSRAALRSLLKPDLEREAESIVTQLGGQLTRNQQR